MTDLKSVNAVRNSRPIGLADIIVIVLMTAVALVFSVGGLGLGKTGNRVLITDGGKTVSYPLDKNREIVLDSLTVVICDGEVSVRDSICPDKICEYTGKISKVNQSIVCLPAGVIIVIDGESDFQVDTAQEK